MHESLCVCLFVGLHSGHDQDLDPLVLEDVSAASSVSTIPRPVSYRTRRHVAVIFVFISISLLILTACLVPFLAIERPANATAISELCQEYSQYVALCVKYGSVHLCTLAVVCDGL